MSANERQPGGNHYQSYYQHWDLMEEHGIGYLESAATKYATRWRTKGSGTLDLEKARHYTEKLIELHHSINRRPRGIAPFKAIDRFGRANELAPSEMMVLTLLTRWDCIEDLEDVLTHLSDLEVVNNNSAGAYD